MKSTAKPTAQPAVKPKAKAAAQPARKARGKASTASAEAHDGKPAGRPHVPLNSQDLYFLDSDTPTAPTHVGGLEIYALPPGAGRDFMQTLYASLKNSPVRADPFDSRLATVTPEPPAGLLGKLRPRPLRKPKPVRVWEHVERVNVEEHLYLHALPRPGGQRELGELVSRLHVNRLDRHRPLWEVHLIEGLEGGRYAVYTKLHHSQFDGQRGMALNQYTRSTDPNARDLPPVWSVQLPDHEGAVHQASSGSLKDAASAWGKALVTFGKMREHKPGEGVIAPYTAPACILNGPLTSRRRLGTQSLPIPRMKALGAAVEGGATVNEILLAVCAGALRRYLLDRDALPSQPLIAACPVAVPRKDAAGAGNAVGQIIVSLATHLAHPRQRLQAVVESSRTNKGLMKTLAPEVYAAYTHLSMIPQILAAKTSFGHKVLNANLVISNVPGPRETQYVNGARLEAMYSASMLLAGQALNITVCNFGDNLDMGIMACPDLCPSPQRIAVYAGEELEVLERAMGIEPGRADAPADKVATKAAARKAPARKAPATSAPATKTSARKALPKTAPAKKAPAVQAPAKGPATQSAARRAPARRS